MNDQDAADLDTRFLAQGFKRITVLPAAFVALDALGGTEGIRAGLQKLKSERAVKIHGSLRNEGYEALGIALVIFIIFLLIRYPLLTSLLLAFFSVLPLFIWKLVLHIQLVGNLRKILDHVKYQGEIYRPSNDQIKRIRAVSRWLQPEGRIFAEIGGVPTDVVAVRVPRQANALFLEDKGHK